MSKCFTILDTNIFDALFVTKGKIGGDRCLAIVDGTGILPQPQLQFGSTGTFNVLGNDKPDFSVYNADIFEFKSTETPSTRFLYPAIIAEQQQSEDALVVIIMKDVKSLVAGKDKIRLYIDVNGERYHQYLVKMEKDSSLTVNTETAKITLTWDGVDLNLNKTTRR
ncbi:MAG TPA: hypothetical protein PLI45_00330 [Candidatus Woesebacteria bacterium]|nr:hypothetical protein [Candidatus Woesebacteria bacterium]